MRIHLSAAETHAESLRNLTTLPVEFVPQPNRGFKVEVKGLKKFANGQGTKLFQ